MKKLVTMVCVLTCLGALSAQNVTTHSVVGTTPQQFVIDNLAGGGVYIFNAKFNGSAGAIADDQIGTFESNGFEGISMENGIVLTSGMRSFADGPNNQSGGSISVYRSICRIKTLETLVFTGDFVNQGA